jgi:glycosyltransferase involved in cell wall biosynthesis
VNKTDVDLKVGTRKGGNMNSKSLRQIKVSVIIPAYNVERYIKECLDSVVSQTLRDIEVIVINDGSTDGTGEIAVSYCKNDSRVRYVVQENAGVSAARNRGAALATGEYLYFLDSDDFIDPVAMEVFYTSAVENRLPVILGEEIHIFGNEIQFADLPIERERKWPLTILDPTAFMAGNKFRVMACKYMLKKTFWDQLPFQFMVGVIHEDCEFTPKFVVRADRIGVLDFPFYYYRRRAGSITASFKSVKKVESLKQNADRLHEFCVSTEEDATWKPFIHMIVANLTIRAVALSAGNADVFEGNLKGWVLERKENLLLSPKKKHHLIAWGFEHMRGLTIAGLHFRYFVYNLKDSWFARYRIWKSERVG